MCDEGGCNDLSYRFKYDTEKKQCKEIVNKQGESNTEPTSMAKIYQEYVDQGGYESVCKDVSKIKETCEVGADLQPRYYCKEGYVKDNDGIDGDSNHCTDNSSGDNSSGDNSGSTQGESDEGGSSVPQPMTLNINAGPWTDFRERTNI